MLVNERRGPNRLAMRELANNNVPLDQVFVRLRLEDLGWDHTVSTVAFTGGLSGYDEMKSQPGAAR